MSKFLVIDGLDGSGKGSVTRMLRAYLNEKGVENDLISFPMYDILHGDTPAPGEICELGDIVLSLERAAEQAEEFGHSYERECAFLTVHSARTSWDTITWIPRRTRGRCARISGSL